MDLARPIKRRLGFPGQETDVQDQDGGTGDEENIWTGEKFSVEPVGLGDNWLQKVKSLGQPTFLRQERLRDVFGRKN